MEKWESVEIDTDKLSVMATAQCGFGASSSPRRTHPCDEGSRRGQVPYRDNLRLTATGGEFEIQCGVVELRLGTCLPHRIGDEAALVEFLNDSHVDEVFRLHVLGFRIARLHRLENRHQAGNR